MANYHYPKLTLLDEADLHEMDPIIFNNAIIAKVPPWVTSTIDHQSIANAIQQQFHVDMKPENISKFNLDYFIQVPSVEANIRMLSQGFLNVSTNILTLMPWTSEYGSTTVPLPRNQNSNPATYSFLSSTSMLPPNEHLTIQVSGIPPHLCCELSVQRLFSKICTVRNITLTRATLTYWVDAYGPSSVIPNIAHIGVSKATQYGDLVNVWSIWYETCTDDMWDRISATEDRTSQRRGSSELGTEHREEAPEQYFEFADIETDISPNNSTDTEPGWESDRSYKYY